MQASSWSLEDSGETSSCSHPSGVLSEGWSVGQGLSTHMCMGSKDGRTCLRNMFCLQTHRGLLEGEGKIFLKVNMAHKPLCFLLPEVYSIKALWDAPKERILFSWDTPPSSKVKDSP